jgi:hypothetical protein
MIATAIMPHILFVSYASFVMPRHSVGRPHLNSVPAKNDVDGRDEPAGHWAGANHGERRPTVALETAAR